MSIIFRLSCVCRNFYERKSVLRASPNLISNCFLGRKNFSLHYHCLYRHHFKTGEGRGVRERSSLIWLGTDTLTKESPAFYTVRLKRLPEIMYFLSISLFSCYGIRLTSTHAVLKIIASLQVNKVFCLGVGGEARLFDGDGLFRFWGKVITRPRRGSRIFSEEGVHSLLLYFNANKPHSFFFAEYQLY